MDLQQHLRLMADYHSWATRQLFVEVDRLDDGDYYADRGLFFRSVHGTLNHLLVAESIWRGRLLEQPSSIGSLDAELERDRATLRARSFDSAAMWRPFVDALSAEDIAADLVYRNLKGDPLVAPRAVVLAHLFNHATHHRGQITAALTQVGGNAPVLDLAAFLPIAREVPRVAASA